MLAQLIFIAFIGLGAINGTYMGCRHFSCDDLGHENCEDDAAYEANPCDCTSYYICYECQQFLQYCPDGMVWNNHTQDCTFETNYNCWVSTFVVTYTGTFPPTTAPQNPAIFCAARDQPLTEAELIVRYPVLMANHGGYYNLLSSLYQAPRPSMYGFIYGCGTRRYAQTNFGLRTADKQISDILIGNTAFNGHTSLGRLQLYIARRGEIFYTSMAFGTQLFSSINREAYFGGFEMDKAMQIDAAFSAGLQGPKNTTGTVLWDQVDIDNLNGYNPYTGGYEVQYPGVYYVAVTIGIPTEADTKLRVSSNRMGRLYDVMTTSHEGNGPRMAVNAMCFFMLEHELINVILDAGSLYSDFEEQTSIDMFLYQPRHVEAQAWSVYTIANWTALTQDLNPFPYKSSNVNHHGLYHFGDHKVHIDTRGLYMIHINCGSVPGVATMMQLFVGEVRGWIAAASHNTTNSGGWLSYGRDLIVELFDTDQVYTRLTAGTSVHSGVYLPTSFTGMLLYQIIDN